MVKEPLMCDPVGSLAAALAGIGGRGSGFRVGRSAEANILSFFAATLSSKEIKGTKAMHGRAMAATMMKKFTYSTACCTCAGR